MRNHEYPRIEETLRSLAVRFSSGDFPVENLPGKLEELAAYTRIVVEAEKCCAGEPNDYAAKLELYSELKIKGTTQPKVGGTGSPNGGG